MHVKDCQTHGSTQDKINSNERPLTTWQPTERHAPCSSIYFSAQRKSTPWTQLHKSDKKKIITDWIQRPNSNKSPNRSLPTSMCVRCNPNLYWNMLLVILSLVDLTFFCVCFFFVFGYHLPNRFGNKNWILHPVFFGDLVGNEEVEKPTSSRGLSKIHCDYSKF